MGSNSASTGGGGGGVGPAGITKKGTYGTVKEAKKVSKRNELRTFIKEGGVTGAIISGLTKGEEVNRKFFEEKVKPAGKSKYDTYEDYIKARGKGEVDAYGREITSTGGGNQVVQAPLEATTMPVNQLTVMPKPSEVEVTAEEARARANELISKKKRKGRGRSLMVLTSPQGLTNEGLTLSKKTLLGI